MAGDVHTDLHPLAAVEVPDVAADPDRLPRRRRVLEFFLNNIFNE